MDSPPDSRSSNRLAIRCNRQLPACERCTSKGISCSYPDRQPRSRRSKERQPNKVDRDLSAILDRLQRIEERAATGSAPSVHTNTPPTFQDPLGDVGSCNSQCNSHNSPGPGIDDIAGASSTNSDTPPEDVASTLSKAVQLIEQKRQRRHGATSAIRHAISIPVDAAKSWIQDYYAHAWGVARCFAKLVDRRLMEMMPDIESLEGVYVDANLLLIYYCMLWHGLFYSPTRTPSSRRPDRHYMEAIFTCCMRIIPVWQNETSGTVYDFIAAMFITETAIENLQFGLSWEMHKKACEYAQTLGLHQMDSSEADALLNQNGIPRQQPTALDDFDRMGLWELIQIDLLYRLVNDKPASLPVSLDDWRVNMPWLTEDRPPDDSEAVPVMAFLARSRLTIILTQYFQYRESADLDDRDRFIATIESLCTQVDIVFNEWQVESWLQSYECNKNHSWILTDLALSGYTCMLFMHRNPWVPSNTSWPFKDNQIIRSDSSVRASRGTLQTTQRYLEAVGSPTDLQVVSWFLGVFHVHVAYAHLADAVLSDSMKWASDDNLRLLKDFALYMERMAITEPELLPLKQAFLSVFAKVQRIVKP